MKLRTRTIRLILLAAALLAVHTARADRVVTILTDFEDDSVAPSIGDVQNLLAGDCTIQPVSIPARGTRSLQIDIGATQPNAAATCNFLFRLPKRFTAIDRAAAFCWIKSGNASVGFRFRDARNALYETTLVPIKESNRWVHVAADADARHLKPLTPNATEPKPPLQLQGVRVATPDAGLQTVYVDEVQLEHQVSPEQVVLPDFVFNEPTRIYEPGSTVGAAVQLENRSREKAAKVDVELAWLRPDDSVLKTEQKTISLPVSSADLRAVQAIDFPQKLEEPGLYRLVAKLHGASPTLNILDTTIAVTPSNRLLPRGRALLFGVRANLFREPIIDQTLEIAVARDIGVQFFALDTPWSAIEPKAGASDWRALDRLLTGIIGIDAVPMLIITDAPGWLPADAAAAQEALGAFLERATAHVGRKVQRYALAESALPFVSGGDRSAVIAALQKRLSAASADIQILPPAILADPAAANSPFVSTTGGKSRPRIATSVPEADAPARYWLHAPEPLAGPGYFADAEDVLRMYIAAASQGYTSLVWSELRDDDNDPSHPGLFHGLVRRDFSPRMSLIGYAAAAGQLTGTRYAGPVHGAPPEFESAMFIGSDRQLAVLLPRPNRVLPGMIAPLRGVEGAFEVRDFERQPIRTIESPAGNLAVTSRRPVFLTLKPKSAQPEPQIGLGKPWLRFPSTVFCADKCSFNIEIDAPAGVKEGFAQLAVPANAGLDSSFSARAIKTKAAETIVIPVELTRDSPVAPRAALGLRVTLDKLVLEAAIDVRPMIDLRPLSPSEPLVSPAHLLGTLQGKTGETATASGSIYGAVDGGALRLSVVTKDNKLIAASAGIRGDQLVLGVSAMNSDVHFEWRITADAKNAAQVENSIGDHALPATATAFEGGLRFDLQLPIGALQIPITGASTPAGTPPPPQSAAAAIMLLAVAYEDEDGPAAAQVLTWGTGLGGSRSAKHFNALRLSP
jgi:hypothetical protein